MLRGAVQRHEQENQITQNTQFKPPSQQSSQSANTHASVQQSVTSYTGKSVQNALRQAPLSTLNTQRNPTQNYGMFAGIKRTSSGLAKAFDGSFEVDRGSQGLPSKSQIPQAQSTDLFDIDDFDSDVDLDFEEPKAKTAVAYPKLPTQPTQPQQLNRASIPKPVVYPTLPRQQSIQSAFKEDSGYGSGRPPVVESQSIPPPSSEPLPWSSSPISHMTASRDPASIRQFTYNGPGGSNVKYNDPPVSQPAKRRTLPWLKDGAQAQQDEEDVILTSTTSRSTVGPQATPATRDRQKSSYPWNTTASAVKEQQRKHREEVKKTVKTTAGDDVSIAKAKSKNTKVPRVFLSEEQQHVLDLVVEQKKSAFFTGSAGTGKSVLLKEIISSLRRRYVREPDRVAVTASTGLAACNVGGVTLHSFAGIGLGKEAVPELVKKIKKNQKAKHRWMRTKVLVVDEVSMVDGELFDKLEAIARQMRGNGRPFGGIQLVITGDFFQLPPVPDSGKVAKFAFDAATWNTTIEYTIGLHHVFRQKDPVFAGMLNEMREGRLSESSIKAFRSLSRELKFEDAIGATELFPLRSEVERANAGRLSMLQGDERVFEARDGGTVVDKVQRDKLLSNCMAPETIVLKKGSQVMLIKNVDESLVNGSLGNVLGFLTEDQFGHYSTNEEEFLQGEDGVFVSQDHINLSKEEKAKRRIQENLTTSRKWPMVRFSIADGTYRDMLCQPESWKIELPNGEVQASRMQVPLILAWALSIHKAQGQTLDRVKVDLGKVFEKGQAYVALSRATSMSGLQVLRFDPKKVNAHERVRTFYSNLARVEMLEKGKQKAKKTSMKPGMPADDYERMLMEEGL